MRGTARSQPGNIESRKWFVLHSNMHCRMCRHMSSFSTSTLPFLMKVLLESCMFTPYGDCPRSLQPSLHTTKHWMHAQLKSTSLEKSRCYTMLTLKTFQHAQLQSPRRRMSAGARSPPSLTLDLDQRFLAPTLLATEATVSTSAGHAVLLPCPALPSKQSNTACVKT